MSSERDPKVRLSLVDVSGLPSAGGTVQPPYFRGIGGVPWRHPHDVELIEPPVVLDVRSGVLRYQTIHAILG